MTDREWLRLLPGCALAMLRGVAATDELAEVERALTQPSATAPIAWDTLRQRLQLTPSEQKSLALIVALELSLELSAMIARLTSDVQRTAIDVELLQRLVYSRDADSAARFVRELSPAGALHKYRLVETTSARDTPFLLRQFRPARRVIEWLHGNRDLDSELTSIAKLQREPLSHERLLMDGSVKERALELAATLDRPRPGEVSPVLVLSGPDGSGRRSMFEAIGAQLKRSLLVIDCDRFPTDQYVSGRLSQALLRESLLFDAIPVLYRVDALRADGSRPERLGVVEDILVQELPGLVGATGPRGESRPVPLARGTVVVEIEAPMSNHREELWKRHLGASGTADDASWAAARYTVTGGLIERAARSALAEAAARKDTLNRTDIHRGIRTTLDAKLAGVARRVVVKQSWADVVLPDDVLEEVREIVARVKHRSLVYDDWGLAGKIGKGFGISALFSGPPGTGKTMIAGIVANELGLDLYQVDLSQVVSKFIGETEKNLSSLFDAAEAGHAVLLFDEADSMFAKRTEVKSSNDRYANLEVNFLLQRMETFAGISILTTNLESSIDEAFKRRLSFRVTFPLPEEDERELLWKTMLPPAGNIAQSIDFVSLASRFEMSGGYIKNAVVRAAFMAADRGEPLGDAHLLKAAALEYAAMGKVMHSSR